MAGWIFWRATQYDMDIELHRFHLRQLLELQEVVNKMSAYKSLIEVVKVSLSWKELFSEN